MRLNPGDRLAHYEIVSLIGQGGMGEVYRASDTRLPREVAIKTSGEQFSERFAREARAIASLNHPNICTLHDIGPDYLVMEMIEGMTLAERIQEGPVKLEEAAGIMRQVADALDYAHEKGVIHRDLKPANIKIRPDGVVKVLDFGLAKLGPEEGSPAPGHDATVTIGATQAGMVLGTAAYMAPEQATGKPVDKRADVWAFGVVFYELLVGSRLHTGDTMQEVMASVLKDQPDLTTIPLQAQRLLKRCLEKDPNKRLRHVGDAMALLDEPPSGVSMVAAVESKPRSRRWIWMVPAAAVLVLLAAFALTMIPGRAPVLPEIRTQIPQPEGLTFNPGTQAIISPDGRWLAFPALGPDNVARMYLRALDSLETKPLPGSEGIRAYSPPPFWSYDSRLVVYAAEDGKLRVSDVALTPARSIAHVGIPYAQGGTWSRDGVILYSANGELMRLSAQGGTPEAVTVRAPDERAQRYPQFLPDGKRFLYLRNWTADKSGIYVGSLDRKPEEQDTKPLLLTNRQAMWVKSEASGETYLLSQQGTNLVAQTFDPDTLELSGTPMTVATEVGSFAGASAGLWSVAATGTLIYRSGGQAQAEIIWRDAAGAAQGVIGTMGDYQTATLSPDGGKLAYRTADAGGNLDVWVRDLAKKSVARLTFDPGPDSFPVWSPDGQKIAFLSRRNGQWGLYEVSLAKPGEERLLFSSPDEMEPSSWSRDGLLAFTRVDSKGLESIWVLPVNGASMPCALDKKQFAEEEAMFSPNGRWIAYMARATGDQQVFVRSFSPENACAVSEKVISFGSGMSPRWNAAGDRLFYYDLNGNVMSVNVQTGANFQQDGAPRRLFGGISTDRTFHVAPKGDRFLVVEAAATNGPPPPFTMVQNWLGKLKK